MDPAVVNSSAFRMLWQNSFNANELHYALPLVYTPPSTETQMVFLASNQNFIRTFDAITGAAIKSRQVQTPYLATHINCRDTPQGVGIQGTPVIDPSTDTVYFFSKSYIPNYRASGNTGVLNGVYYFYGVNIITLEDAPGFPILLDETIAENDSLQYFIGGVSFQHTALTLVAGTVYGGFASHCDNYNYTGMMFGVSVSTKRIVSNFAMESGPNINHEAWNATEGGGRAGVWMSGMSPATDGSRIFIVSGNGLDGQNGAASAEGNSGLRNLEQAVVNFAVSESGGLSVTDYFQPGDYKALDSTDSDLDGCSGGFVLLDKSHFSGTDVEEIGAVVGKSGKLYILNANNLGGYKEGVGQSDNVVQTLQLAAGVWGGCGSYPLEGGFLYCAPIGQAAEKQVFEVGQPTITSLDGKAGSGIMWLTDPTAGLRAWAALPNHNGSLDSLKIPATKGMNKYQRPVFGNGKLYVTDSSGTLYCMGS
ncbi:hypothetical protein V8E51_015531 [Hyaloscypha variabilis]